MLQGSSTTRFSVTSVISTSAHEAGLLIRSSFLTAMLVPIFVSCTPSSVSSGRTRESLLFCCSGALFTTLIMFTAGFVLVGSSVFQCLLLIKRPRRHEMRRTNYSPLLLSYLRPIRRFPPPGICRIPFLP